MKIRRTILLCVIGLLALGAASGAVFTMRTIAMYNGVCDPLTGFPAMLMAAGFVEKGECGKSDHKKGGKSGCIAEPCMVGGKKGTCAQLVLKKKTLCYCKVNNHSR